MITYPALDNLMEKVDSPYTLVIMASRRARQLNIGDNELMEEYKSHKAVSRSLEEIVKGKVTYEKSSGEESIERN